MERKTLIDLVDEDGLFDRSYNSEGDEFDDDKSELLKEIIKDRPYSDNLDSRDDSHVGAFLQGSLA